MGGRSLDTVPRLTWQMEQRNNFACHAHHDLTQLGATNAGYMRRNCRRSCNLCGGGGGGGRQVSVHER